MAGVGIGREHDEEMTIFNSAGLAFGGMAFAKLVYEKAKEKGRFLSLDLV